MNVPVKSCLFPVVPFFIFKQISCINNKSRTEGPHKIHRKTIIEKFLTRTRTKYMYDVSVLAPQAKLVKKRIVTYSLKDDISADTGSKLSPSLLSPTSLPTSLSLSISLSLSSCNSISILDNL